MLTTTNSVRKTAWLLFAALFTTYLALGPGTVGGRGYVYEDMQSGMGLLASFNAWVKGRVVPPILWTRHGPVPLLLDLPFIKIGKLFLTPDFIISLEPILLTAALLTIVYVWLRKLCTPGMSLLLTMIGAFGTMLWPYAYIGLETKQSFFILLAGYLSLANGTIRTWPKLLLFSVVAGLSLSMKSTGIVLAPAILYIVYVQFQKEWLVRWKQLATALVIIGVIATVNIIGWKFFWDPRGGGPHSFQQWTIDSTFQFFMNVLGLFGSSTKGLFVFAPVLLISIYAIPRSFRAHRELTIFGLLVTASLVTLLSTLRIVADELWGPRFLHVTVAPILLTIGAAWPRFEWRKHVPLLVLGAVGLGVSFLGAFYYYGVRGWAADAAGQSVLEWLEGDSVWNEVHFDALLFRVWIKGGKDPVPWSPEHVWAWTKPPNAPPWKVVNLRDYAEPQSFLLYYWNRDIEEGAGLVFFKICLVCVVLGPLLLLWVLEGTVRGRTGKAIEPTAAPALESSSALFLRKPDQSQQTSVKSN